MTAENQDEVTLSITLNERVRDLVENIQEILGDDRSEQASADVVTAAVMIAYYQGIDPHDIGQIVRAVLDVIKVLQQKVDKSIAQFNP